jgi:MFS family permease
VKGRLLAPLRHRDFAALYASTVVSNLGDWLDLVALLVMVSVVWQLGATGLATIALAAAIPMLAAPLIGVLVDRWAPRRLMIIADLARVVLTAGLLLADQLWIVAALVFGRAVFGVAFTSASQLMIRRAVPPDELVAANAVNQATIQAVKVFGPAAGGLLVAVLSPQAIFGLNSVSFAISALALVLVRGVGPSPVDGPQPLRSMRAELVEGLRFVLSSRILVVTSLTMAVLVFVVFVYDSIAPLAVLGLGLDRPYVGYMVAAVGVGGVLGSVLIGQLGMIPRPFLVMGPAVGVIGLMVAAIGYGVVNQVRIGPLPWLLAAGVLGAASAGVLVPYPVILQTNTPERLSGRVWATMSTVPSVLNVLAPICAVALVSALGVGATFVAAGIVLAGYGLLVTSALRTYRLTPDPAEHPIVTPGKEVNIMSDKLTQLTNAGFSISPANDAQRDILASLSDEEIRVLLDVRQRVEAAGSDIEGHATVSPGVVGGWLW